MASDFLALESFYARVLCKPKERFGKRIDTELTVERIFCSEVAKAFGSLRFDFGRFDPMFDVSSSEFKKSSSSSRSSLSFPPLLSLLSAPSWSSESSSAELFLELFPVFILAAFATGMSASDSESLPESEI